MQGLFADRFLKRFFRNRMQEHEVDLSCGIVDVPENGAEPYSESNCSSEQERAVEKAALVARAEQTRQSIDPKNSEEG